MFRRGSKFQVDRCHVDRYRDSIWLNLIELIVSCFDEFLPLRKARFSNERPAVVYSGVPAT